MDEVKERSSAFLQISFIDEDALPVIPTAASYRIDDEESLTAIKALANITPLDTVVVILITSEENRILNENHGFEVRTVTVSYDYTSDMGAAHSNSYFKYKVKNLYGISAS